MRISYYCKCGASMTANITSASIVKRIGYMWVENHSGEGHGLCKKEECYKARRKLENRAVNPRQEEVRNEQNKAV